MDVDDRGLEPPWTSSFVRSVGLHEKSLSPNARKRLPYIGSFTLSTGLPHDGPLPDVILGRLFGFRRSVAIPTARHPILARVYVLDWVAVKSFLSCTENGEPAPRSVVAYHLRTDLGDHRVARSGSMPRSPFSMRAFDRANRPLFHLRFFSDTSRSTDGRSPRSGAIVMPAALR